MKTFSFWSALFRVTLWLAACISLYSCGGGGSSESQGPGDTVGTDPGTTAGLPFKSLPLRLSLEVGGQSALATIGTTAAVTWRSSDPTVATVDANGIVTAVHRGRAAISASDGTLVTSTAVGVWQTTGDTPDATSGALIDAAETSGRIDAEQAIVYRVYALFADDRLPAEFEGAPDPNGTISMQLLSGKLPSLSKRTQDQLLPFFIPPIYVDSWFGRQLGLSSGTAGPSGAAQSKSQASGKRTQAVQFSCGAEKIAGLKRRTTQSFTFWSLDIRELDEVVDYLVANAEDIYARERALFQRAAKPDTDEPCSGGDGAIDIYIVPFPLKAGLTFAYPGRCQDVPAYIVLNSDEVGIFGKLQGFDKTTGLRYLRSLLAHEVLHTIQFGMTRHAPCADYSWADEATAQWVMDELFPGDNFEDGVKKVDFTARAGVFFAEYVLGGHREALEKGNGYSDYIFFQFIARELGSQVVKQVFDAWTGQGSVDALDTALRASGSSMGDIWPKFAQAMWNDANEHVLDDLNRMSMEGYEYGVHFAIDSLRARGRMGSKKITQAGAGRARFDLLQHLKSGAGYALPPRSMGFERLEFNDSTVSSVFITNAFQHPDVKLNALIKIDGHWKKVEDWSTDHAKSFCRDKASERLEALILIISNSAKDATASPVTSDRTITVATSNVGCWKWQGESSERIISDDGFSNTGDYTAAATGLVFEVQSLDWFAGVTSFAPTAGTANGLYNSRSVQLQCDISITGPSKTIALAEGLIMVGLDLDLGSISPPSREVSTLTGFTVIDSTSNSACAGERVVKTFANAWGWLAYPLATKPVAVSADGRTMEGNLTESQDGSRAIHTFRFTAMRE